MGRWRVAFRALKVFDLACFVGDDGQRRERRLRIFLPAIPDDRECPDDAGRTPPFFAHLRKARRGAT